MPFLCAVTIDTISTVVLGADVSVLILTGGEAELGLGMRTVW